MPPKKPNPIHKEVIKIFPSKMISKNSNPILVTKSGVPLNAKKKDIPKQLEEEIGLTEYHLVSIWVKNS